ncbi:hypothetical protein J6590_022752 [Homalodisca vitripennis]|nr:hypothetical protein J6590_022752 [Homalodisca vitripennis]
MFNALDRTDIGFPQIIYAVNQNQSSDSYLHTWPPQQQATRHHSNPTYRLSVNDSLTVASPVHHAGLTASYTGMEQPTFIPQTNQYWIMKQPPSRVKGFDTTTIGIDFTSESLIGSF